MAESYSVTFEFTPATENDEARLREELIKGTSTSSYEIHGEKAEILWKKIQDLTDEFPGPRIIMGLRGA